MKNIFFAFFCLSVLCSSKTTVAQATLITDPANGEYCLGQGNDGVKIKITNSSFGIVYELISDTGPTGETITGNGSIAVFDDYYQDGVYETEPSTGSVTVTGNTPPTASFTWSPPPPEVPCANDPVTFSAAPEDSISVYEWEFNDGSYNNTVTTTNNVIDHTFEALGNGPQTFAVELTITDDNGCTDEVSNNVTIQQKPDATLSCITPGINTATEDGITIFSYCGPFTSVEFTFENNSTTQSTNSMYTINWGYGEPQTYSSQNFFQEPHTYGVGLHTLDYLVEGDNDCNNNKTYFVFVGNNPKGGIYMVDSYWSDFPPFEVNVGIVDTTAYNANGTTYELDWGDDSIDYFTQTQVNDIINTTGNFNHIYEICSNELNECNGQKYCFIITLKMENPCIETPSTVCPVIISCPVDPWFDVNNGSSNNWGVGEDTLVACNDVEFDNQTIPGFWIIGGGSDYTQDTFYEWDFGDPGSGNNTSTDPEPTHTFSTVPGCYYVTLTAWTGVGPDPGQNSGIISITRKVCIQEPPVPGFTLGESLECVLPYVVTTTNNSVIGNLGTPEYLWTIADLYDEGGVSVITGDYNSYEPVFQFDNPGEFDITLKVSNSCGDVDTEPQSIIVKGKPVVTLSIPTPMCITDALTINVGDVEYNPSYGTISNYEWIFDQGSSGTIPSTNPYPAGIIYPNTGDFDIKVRSQNECGWTEWVTQSIEIIDDPDITGFIYNDGFDYGIPVPEDTCYSADPIYLGAIISGEEKFNILNWTCTTATITNNGVFTPDIAGSHLIQLIYGPENCSDESSFVINVDGVTADAGLDIAECIDDNTPPIPLVGNPAGGVWTPDTHVFQNGPDYYFDPTAPLGTHIITYTYTNTETGCSSDDTKSVTIDMAPDTEFSYDPDNTFCVGEDQAFEALINPPGTTYQWKIDGNPEGTGTNLTYNFGIPGEYEIELTGTSPYADCISSAIDTITIEDIAPDPIFTLVPGCDRAFIEVDEDLVSFLASFNGSSEWYKDNDSQPFSTENIPSPNYIPFPSGAGVLDHEVKWFLDGCGDPKQFSQTVTVFRSPTSKIMIDWDNTNLANVTFINASNYYSDCEWILPPNETHIFNDKNQPVVLPAPGIYTATLIANNNGCYDTAYFDYEYIAKGLYIPNAFLPDSPPQDSVNLFKAVGIGLLSYTLKVYSTWGELIWETSRIVNTKPADGWDGKDGKGKKLPQDVYIWYAHAVFRDSTIWQGQDGSTTGNVTLLR